MKSVLIVPYSRKLPDNIDNPKNYPYWQELVDILVSQGYDIHQLVFGTDEHILNNAKSSFNLTESQQLELLNKCDIWISVDTYFQHFAKYNNKPGIVLWTVSNPEIFGYSENLNLYKDKKYFISEEDTYLDWVSISKKYEEHIKNIEYLTPNEIINSLKEYNAEQL